MTNASILAAFERMWQHVLAKIETTLKDIDSLTKVYAQPDEPINPKEGDVWIDTDEDVIQNGDEVSY